jgi:two-component system phosphate regulon sensor histidine kinase PhoR
LKRIFERFYRVDKARARPVGGTGLGLPIVKQVVEQMGGTVNVESTLGRGAKFIILLKGA